MFWDVAANFYDIFEKNYNGEVNLNLAQRVAELMDKDDRVLECACGTGMITKAMASNCRELIATDFSVGMLKKAKKNCSAFPNVKIRKGNIMKLNCKDGAFDKVVAGNVIHLLDEPYKALDELIRACKDGGKVIIPTYVNNENAGKPSVFIRILEKFGADFKKQFDFASYQQFFEKTGYKNIEYILVEGKMPCAVAIITKNQ
ncbi:MAG: class I SAM-dependent methyltransferase [Lachnospiraceae bacterium]|nr:class I SAM-dependent methyltransferase [Lachnospiraceae bacterium]